MWSGTISSGVATVLLTEHLRNCGSFSGWGNRWDLLWILRILLFGGYHRLFPRNMVLDTRLRILLRLRILRARSFFSNISSGTDA